MGHRVFISAAEVSADLRGAEVIRNLKKHFPGHFEFEGLGGENMRAQGCRILEDLSTQSSIGIVESLRFVGTSLGLLRRIKKHFEKKRPQLILAIDGQGRNLPLIKLASKLGIKTAYYFPPPVFIWGAWNIKKLKKVELLLCPFKENAAVLKRHHPHVVYTGHPFSHIASPSRRAKRQAKQALGFSQQHPVVAIFPGSRYQEITSKTAIFLKAGSLLKKRMPEVQFVLSIAHPQYRKRIASMVKTFLPETILLDKDAHRALLSADFLFTVSGTATLEACFYGVPMAIGYKISWLSYHIAKRLVKPKYIGMPNILAAKEIYGEFINRDLTVEKISRYALSVLQDKNLQQKIRLERNQLIDRIRVTDPYTALCKSIYGLLEK